MRRIQHTHTHTHTRKRRRRSRRYSKGDNVDYDELLE
jgi:hypothetical protein